MYLPTVTNTHLKKKLVSVTPLRTSSFKGERMFVYGINFLPGRKIF